MSILVQQKRHHIRVLPLRAPTNRKNVTMTQPLTRLIPDGLPDSSKYGHSQVTIAEPGRMAYISGQVAWSPDSPDVPGDLAGQAALVVRNARTALAAAGAAPKDVVMARVYVTDLTPARIGEAMPHLEDLFGNTLPSLTGIGVAALAGPDLQIELELIARLPD